MKQPPVIVIQLVHIHGPLKGEIKEFSEPVISIGRHPSSHLCFPADLTSISRRHAEIIREGNRFKVVDHSTNGTFVNGKRVAEAYLKDGDVLMFAEGGPKVSFLTQMKEIPVEAEAPSQPPYHPEEKPRTPLVQPSVVKESAIHRPEREGQGMQSVQGMKVPLIIQYGPTLRSFDKLPVVIGGNPACDFTIAHPGILDRHVQIFHSQGHYWVKDLTGQGLVRINQQPVTVEAPLKKDDQLCLSRQGPSFLFLGDGRLAEVEQPPLKETSNTHNEKGGRAEQNGHKTKRGPMSFLDKLVQKYTKNS